MRRIIYAAIVIALGATMLSAQSNKDGFIRTKDGFEFELKAAINFIGGAAPMDIPQEVRSIDSYNPTFGGSFEGVATKWFGDSYGVPEWGISAGLKLENRGMKTQVTTKSFHTSVTMDNAGVEGYWTGEVVMEYSSNLLSLPLQAHYRFNRNWKVRGGLYLGYQIDGKFSGMVQNGHLRDGTPVGEKLIMEQPSLYDFSSNMQRWQWGGVLGFSWRAYRHFHINADLNWGFSQVFKRNFTAINYAMYPIYLQAGFGYQF